MVFLGLKLVFRLELGSGLGFKVKFRFFLGLGVGLEFLFRLIVWGTEFVVLFISASMGAMYDGLSFSSSPSYIVMSISLILGLSYLFCALVLSLCSVAIFLSVSSML